MMTTSDFDNIRAELFDAFRRADTSSFARSAKVTIPDEYFPTLVTALQDCHKYIPGESRAAHSVRAHARYLREHIHATYKRSRDKSVCYIKIPKTSLRFMRAYLSDVIRYYDNSKG